MAKYYVVGQHAIAGVEPGGVVDGDGLNVESLVAAGHLAPVREKPKTKAARDDEGKGGE